MAVLYHLPRLLSAYLFVSLSLDWELVEVLNSDSRDGDNTALLCL
jgi:hypothetical protein